jgi:formylglycine-generating enzyme required for sulfatase activity
MYISKYLQFFRWIFVLFALFGLFAACTNPPTKVDDKSGIEMVLIPAGEFQMTTWDELKNVKRVKLEYVDDFYIDVFEVTNQQYAKCVDEGVCVEPVNTRLYSDQAFLDHPVIFVTWGMANSFCEWRGARLPTKAEWEKAAADELKEVEFYWDNASPLCQVGSRLGAGIDENRVYDVDSKSVGMSTPNTYGLYEMTGGMWEWVQDRHELDIYDYSPEYVSFLRMYRWSGYGPLYNRYICSFRCARSP